jgi:hypothetical protein
VTHQQLGLHEQADRDDHDQGAPDHGLAGAEALQELLADPDEPDDEYAVADGEDAGVPGGEGAAVRLLTGEL